MWKKNSPWEKDAIFQNNEIILELQKNIDNDSARIIINYGKTERVFKSTSRKYFDSYDKAYLKFIMLLMKYQEKTIKNNSQKQSINGDCIKCKTIKASKPGNLCWRCFGKDNNV